MSAEENKWVKRSKGELAGILGNDILYAIDNYDRPGSAFAEGPYAEAETYAYAFEDKPGRRIPKAGAGAEAGVGRARAEWRVCEAEAKGPNASAGAHADVLNVGAEAAAGLGQARAQCSIIKAEVKGPNVSVGTHVGLIGLNAMARAQVASASASAGPVGVKAGLGFDTGVAVDPLSGSAEIKVLGTGVSLGRKVGISLLGSELSFNLW